MHPLGLLHVERHRSKSRVFKKIIDLIRTLERFTGQNTDCARPHPGVANQTIAGHDFGVGSRPRPGHAHPVVDFGRAINAKSDVHLILPEQFTPLGIQQCPIRLDGVADAESFGGTFRQQRKGAPIE